MSTRKIKLDPKKTREWTDYADTAFMGLVAFVLAVMMLAAIVSCNRVKDAQSTPPEVIKPAEGPGKTWREPGSARDTFDKNFGR